MDETRSEFQNLIRIPLIHSKTLFRCVILGHLLVALLLVNISLTIPDWPLFIVLALIFARTAYCFIKGVFPYQVTELLLDKDDNWFVINQHDERHEGSLMTPVFVHPRLVILRIQFQQGQFAVILINDNIEENSFRRLRVRLRFPI